MTDDSESAYDPNSHEGIVAKLCRVVRADDDGMLAMSRPHGRFSIKVAAAPKGERARVIVRPASGEGVQAFQLIAHDLRLLVRRLTQWDEDGRRWEELERPLAQLGRVSMDASRTLAHRRADIASTIKALP